MFIEDTEFIMQIFEYHSEISIRTSFSLTAPLTLTVCVHFESRKTRQKQLVENNRQETHRKATRLKLVASTENHLNKI